MPWSVSSVPTAAKNLPQRAKRIFVTAANAALSRGKSDQDAVIAGMMAVKNAGYKKEGDKWVLSEAQRRSSTGNPTKKATPYWCPKCEKTVAVEAKTADPACPVCSSTLIRKALEAEDLSTLVKLATIPQWLRGQLLDKLQKVADEVAETPEETTEEKPADPAHDHTVAMEAVARQADIQAEVAKAAEGDLNYKVLKAEDERRFTLGPVYSPGNVDAHDETIDADDLQTAMWDYVAKGDRTIYLQHSKRRAGEWLELVTWPADIKTNVTKADGDQGEIEFPAGTVFMGVRWDEDVWPLVKTGKITGYSLGGRATRVEITDTTSS